MPLPPTPVPLPASGPRQVVVCGPSVGWSFKHARRPSKKRSVVQRCNTEGRQGKELAAGWLGVDKWSCLRQVFNLAMLLLLLLYAGIYYIKILEISYFNIAKEEQETSADFFFLFLSLLAFVSSKREPCCSFPNFFFMLRS